MHQPISSLVVMTFCVRSVAAFSRGGGRMAAPTRRIVARHSSAAASTRRSGPISSFAVQQWCTGTSGRSSQLFSTENGSDATSSSFDFDEDARSEQLLAENPIPPPPVPPPASSAHAASRINGGADATKPAGGRYDDLLESVGLVGDDSISSLGSLNSLRPVSTNDVFCNRELRMGGLKAIGFDMDYTLAQYEQPAFDKLAFDGAKEKLVKALGYPEEVLDFEYDHKFWVRGLIIDTLRGNFLKIDRHKYVRLAYHGFTPISSELRKHLYSRTFNVVPSFTERHFVNMDTVFQHVDAHLFALLVDLKDKGGHEFLDLKTYDEIYRQVRECIDLCHRDGVIKDEAALNPEKYIVPDPDMIPMLQQMRESGVKTFLLTNSYWEYTSVAMNFLYHGRKVDEETMKKNEWMDLFDVVVVGSCKPAYLLDSYLSLFRVRPEDGSLLNTDGLFEIEALGKNGAQKFLEQGKVFQGGNYQHLTKMLEIDAGEEILYVGDHLYSDVLRSKRTLGWRSCFIVPEIADEMKVFREQLPLRKQIADLRTLRDELSLYGDSVRRNAEDPTTEAVQVKLRQIDEDDEKIKTKLIGLAERYHAAFHPVWGQMFHAGYQDSRFAYFVQNYACLYTSKATNLGLATTSRSFRTSGEMLPHDKLLAGRGTDFVVGEEDFLGAGLLAEDVSL